MCFGSSSKQKTATNKPLRPRQNQQKKKVILLGDMHVGKSSICEFYKQKCPVKNLPSTLGVSYFEFNIITDSGADIHLDVWDTAGHEAYSSLLNMYYHNANIVFLVFDMSARKSFDRVDFWINELRELADEKDMSLVLIGNKCDIDPSQRQISTAQASSYAKDKGFQYFETSALTGQGIVELFSATADSIASGKNNKKTTQ